MFNYPNLTIYHCMLLLICLLPMTKGTLLNASNNPKPCSSQQNYIFQETYKKQIQTLGLTIPLEQVNSIPCQTIIHRGKDSSLNALIIKELNFTGSVCPLVVIYNSHSKSASIQLQDLVIPDLNVSCNYFFQNESEEQKKERILKVLNSLVFDLLDPNSDLFNIQFWQFYLTDFLDLDRVFTFKVISYMYQTFIKKQTYFNEYFLEDIFSLFGNFYDTYLKQFMQVFSQKVNFDDYNEQIKGRLQSGGYFAAQHFWQDNTKLVHRLNFYTLSQDSETGFNKVLLKCCSYNVKELNKYMKHFMASTFKDSDQKQPKRDKKLKEDAESMNVLIGELEKVDRELVQYFMQEKLIAHGVSLLYKQGKVNWVFSSLIHSLNSCGFDQNRKNKVLDKMVKAKLLPTVEGFSNWYCSPKLTEDKELYSVLFKVDFMEDSQNHQYCEVVFEVQEDNLIVILPRTNSHYMYYLPCDNQQNPTRFHLMI